MPFFCICDIACCVYEGCELAVGRFEDCDMKAVDGNFPVGVIGELIFSDKVLSLGNKDETVANGRMRGMDGSGAGNGVAYGG